MRIIDDVAIPDELIEAASDGSLVLFVGAGVSLNEPSGLPLFGGLAEQLAQLQGEIFDDSLPPDAFVGRLCDAAPVVREQARAIISAPSSRPNSGHRAIVRLAAASAAFRIVTTNYDEHLDTAAADAGIHPGDVYHGPAVPLGRDFTGVVYLHGKVSRPASEMVLTDVDFGRAYLTDGWARSFVQDLFMHRTVLFVGYSHGDSVMKYLARGLPPTTSRFALTEIPGDPKWKDLGITPVSYPEKDEHAALTAVLDAWARRLEMGHLDHRDRVRDIVRSPPPKHPVDADYISHAITTPTGVRAFAEAARGEEWLRWAEEQDIFKELFTGGLCSREESRVLGSWYVDSYVSDPDASELAFATLSRLGPIVCEDLMRDLGHAAYFLGKKAPELARKWTIVIACALRTHSGGSAEMWPSGNGVISGQAALAHLRRATRPYLQLSEERPWFLAEASTETVRIKGNIAWSGTQSEVEQLWDAVRDELADHSTAVLQIFEQSLRDAHDIASIFNGEVHGNVWSFRRSAIEPHSQDGFRDYESTLIDGLRDAGTLIQASDRSLSARWRSDGHALFRRLGIHLLTEDPDLESGQKLHLLLEGRHLFDHHLKHETYRLLAAIAKNLDTSDRKMLLESIIEGPPAFKDDAVLHQRVVFDLIEWLSRNVTDWNELESALVKIRAERPNIGIRKNPDFDYWMESGTWGGALPFAVEEFIELVDRKGPTEAIRQLESQDYGERNFEDPSWDDACSLVRQVVTKRSDLGPVLLQAATSGSLEHRNDLIASAIRGLSDADLSDASIRDAIQEIQPFVDQATFARPISEFCLAKVTKTEHREPTTLEDLDNVASSIWNSHADTFEAQESDDWLMLGLNTWPGFLAQYWVNRIRLRWRANADDWNGLLSTEKSIMSGMLESERDASRPVMAIFAHDLYFIFAADADFATKVLFPIFDVALSDQAVHAWESYMYQARATDSLLDAGFWDLLQKAHQVIVDIENERGESQYWWLVASICVRSSAHTVDRHQLIDRLGGRPRELLVNLIDALADVSADLEDSEAPEIKRAWKSWIREAVQRRSTQPPGMQTSAEKAAWGDMALRLGSFTPEALTLCDGAPGPLGSRTTFKDLRDSILFAHANLVVEAVTRRLEVTPPNPGWHVEHQLGELAGRLAGSLVSRELLRRMAERAMSIGIHSATSWLE